jgi:hypothetical protein
MDFDPLQVRRANHRRIDSLESPSGAIPVTRWVLRTGRFAAVRTTSLISLGFAQTRDSLGEFLVHRFEKNRSAGRLRRRGPPHFLGVRAQTPSPLRGLLLPLAVIINLRQILWRAA